MNKFFRYFLISALSLGSIGLVSCGDDDDESNGGNNGSDSSALTGSPTSVQEISGNKWVANWNQSKAYTSVNGGAKTQTSFESNNVNDLFLTEIEFFTDGTMNYVLDTVVSKGEYSINGTDLTTTYDVLVTKTEYGIVNNVTKYRKNFTFKEGVDIAEFIGGELSDSGYGFEGFEMPMTYIITDYDITQSGNKLYITMIITMKYSDSFIKEFSESFEGNNMFDNMLNSKTVMYYYMVYDKK